MGRRPLQRIQAALAARRYFVGQQTKSKIADDIGVSRFKVARLIDAAIKQGIVRFVITEPDDLNAELGERVRTKYGLKAVLALDGPDMPTSSLTTPLGSLAASLLGEILVDGQRLGIAWGRTLAAMAKALNHLPKVDVIQVAGAPPNSTSPKIQSNSSTGSQASVAAPLTRSTGRCGPRTSCSRKGFERSRRSRPR